LDLGPNQKAPTSREGVQRLRDGIIHGSDRWQRSAAPHARRERSRHRRADRYHLSPHG